MNAAEWLQTNQLGSFAAGTADRIPQRKYHSLLTIRETNNKETLNVLSEVGESLTINNNTFLLHNINYGESIYPHGFQHIASFTHLPLPRWTYVLDDITVVRTFEIDRKKDIIRIYYSVSGITTPVIFRIEPFLTCRPLHQLAHENPFLNGSIKKEKEGFSLQPYPTSPRLYLKVSGVNAEYHSRGEWYRNVFYAAERARGYDDQEDYYSPGCFEIKLSQDAEFSFHFGERDLKKTHSIAFKPMDANFSPVALKRAAEKFLIIKKDGTHSIIAGYPWFEDWDRDTMISLPGLCLSTEKIDFAKEILNDYAARALKQVVPSAPVVAGIAQNIMVDAPLLFIRALELFSHHSNPQDLNTLMPAALHILNSFKNKLDPRVEITPNGLFYVKPGSYASTWMDVVMDGSPLTPRNGFAVDLNALFYNALCFVIKWATKENHFDIVQEWEPIQKKTKESFVKYFWSEEKGYLADVHDGHTADFSLRPNQLWATALPESPITQEMGEKILQVVKEHLVSPIGIRTLSPTHSNFKSHYRGNQRDRDSAYHQGTVWPWLLGIYADSLNNYYDAKKIRAELNPIMQKIKNHFLSEGCIDQIAEVFDAEYPYEANGTPAQAWSLGETIRVAELLSKLQLREKAL